MSRPKKMSLSRIYANCTKAGECKLWKGQLTRDGYPRMYHPEAHQISREKGFGGSFRLGRREVWKLRFGEEAAGPIAMKCGNKLCLEHSHMKIATRRELVLSSAKLHSVARVVSRTINLNKSNRKLGPEQAREIRAAFSKLKVNSRTPERQRLRLEFAAKFGVAPRTVDKVRWGLTWLEKPPATVRSSSIWAMAANEERRAA